MIRADSRRGTRHRNLALAVAATAVALVSLELGTRLLLDPPRYHAGPVEFHPELGFRGVPGHEHESSDDLGAFPFRLSSQGLRGREIPGPPAAKASGVERIAFVGDSFLVAQALREERLVTSLTEASLTAAGRKTEVYNLSGVDTGTAQQLLLLRRLGRPLDLDSVVLFVYPSNDLINNSPGLAGSSSVSAGDYLRPYLVPEDGDVAVTYTHPVRSWLRRHSRIFAALERRVLALAVSRNATWLLPWPPPANTGERVRGGRTPREEFEIFLRHDPGHVWETAWRTSFAVLREFRDECAAMQARLLVVVIPSVYQVQRIAKLIPLDSAMHLVGGRSLDRVLDWNLPEKRLADFFAEAGIEARFLLPALREAVAEGSDVYTRDEHLAAAGHAIAAALVVDWLTGVAGESEPTVFAGRPVQTLPLPAEAPALLDFRARDFVHYLGDGWLEWTPEASGETWGWRSGPRAMAVLPVRDTGFVVRGETPAAARFPIKGKLEILGGPRHAFRIEEPGPFEIRYPRGFEQAIDRISSGGYAAVLLSVASPPGEPRTPAGLIVQQIGFE